MPSSATQEWLDKALEDEQAVEALKARSLWGPASYHIQQSAEKFIKAALVEAGIAPPLTHDLDDLLGLFPGPVPSVAVQSAGALLTQYAWLTRYPGAPPIAEYHVIQAEQELAQIKAWALSVIP